MVKVRYLGIASPKTAFEELKPLRAKLIALQDKCRPFHTDYLILHAAQKALDTAAYHFTGDPNFFASKPEQSKVGVPDVTRPGRDGW